MALMGRLPARRTFTGSLHVMELMVQASDRLLG